jgi:hypothetical protein
MSTPRE